jgi:hypothetical protein
MYSFKGWQNNKYQAFPSERCISNEENVLLLHILQWKSYIRTGTKTVIRKFYLLKIILSCCGYWPTSPFFLLLSEHKHCDNAATNWNSENARSRMFVGKRGYGDKGRWVKYWAHFGYWISPCYGPFSLGERFETYGPSTYLIFQTADNWKRGYWFLGYGGPSVYWTSTRGQPTRGGLPGLSLGDVLTNPHRKNLRC